VLWALSASLFRQPTVSRLPQRVSCVRLCPVVASSLLLWGAGVGGRFKLFVGMLAATTTEENLEQLFKVYGPVVETTVLRHKSAVLSVWLQVVYPLASAFVLCVAVQGYRCQSRLWLCDVHKLPVRY
jgi:hypothetical protein